MAENYELDPDGDLVLILNYVPTVADGEPASSEDSGTFQFELKSSVN